MDKKISELTAAGTLTGTELVEIVQGGVNKQSTTQDIADLAGSGVTREFNRAWSAELLFNKNTIHYIKHTLTGDTTFSVDPDSNAFTQESLIIMEIETDGTHQVFFENYNAIDLVGFKYVPEGSIQSGDTPEAGTYAVMFVRFQGFSMVNWVVPSSEQANLVGLTAPASFVTVPDAVSGDTELDSSWSAVTNAVSYEYQYSSTGGGGPWLPTTPIAIPSGTLYALTGLTPGTTYHTRVRAIGDQITYGNSPWSVSASMTEDSGDSTAPVATFTPADSATDIPVNGLIVIDFDEAIIDADGTTEITNSNVDDYLVVKEDNISGSDIAFTATISSDKRQIVITPVTSWGATQAVFVQVDGIEDVNGNEAAAQDATFTTNDYTEFFTSFNGVNHRLLLGDILDSVITPADSNFEFEVEIENYSTTGVRILLAKDGATFDTRTILFYIYNNSLRAAYGSPAGLRYIEWAGVLDGDPHKIYFAYDGSIDTNNGLDRVTLEIDDVVETGKGLIGIDDALPGSLVDTDNQLAFGVNVNAAGGHLTAAFFGGWARNLIIRSNAGATVELNIANLKEGTDSSGNGYNGTFI